MEKKEIIYPVRMTEEQYRKLEEICSQLRRNKADAFRILIEDKYSELAATKPQQVAA